MRMAVEYDCIHESLIQSHSTDIESLKTRADYKDKRIDELYDKMEKMENKIDTINENVNTIMMKSVQGDSEIDKRVTSLETTVKVLQWVTTLLFGSGIIWVIYSFIH
jgi:peptidoglycan hydrolase CwlO-like protein